MTEIGRPSQHQNVPPPATISPPARSNIGKTTASFAELLHGLVKPCSGPTGFLEDSGTATSPGSGTDEQASVFNAHGLFLGAVHGSLATAVAPAKPAIAQVAAAMISESNRPLRAIEQGGTVLPSVPEESPATATTLIDDVDGTEIHEAPPFASSSVAKRAVLPAPTETTRAPAPAAEVAGSEIKTTESGTFRPIFLRRVLDEMTGAANRVDVSLQTSDHGQAVVAQIDNLDREARGKLRDRIAALLSRHGLSARTVLISGRTDRPSTLEGGR